jgi:hypothetical protein
MSTMTLRKMSLFSIAAGLAACASAPPAPSPDAAVPIKIQRGPVLMPPGADWSRMRLVDEARPLRVYTQMRGIGDPNDAKLLFSADVAQKLGLTNQQVNRQFEDMILQSRRFEVYDDATTVVREGARQNFDGKRMDILIEGQVVGATQEIIPIAPYRKARTTVHLSVQMKDVFSGRELFPGGVSPVGEWGMVQGEGTLIPPNASPSSPDMQISLGNDYQRALDKALRETVVRINDELRPLGRITFVDARSVGMVGGQKHGFQSGDDIVIFHADTTELGVGSERHTVLAHTQPLAVAHCTGVGTETSQCDLTRIDPNYSIAIGDFAVLDTKSAAGPRKE